LSKTARRFTYAEKACVRWGGNLASFQNKEEETKVAKLMSGDKNEYWIGLTEVGREGNWMWTDGTAYDYANW